MAMFCKKCNKDLENRNTKTVDAEKIQRTKVCPSCGYRIYTIEINVDAYNDMATFYNGLLTMFEKYAMSKKQ
jgi:hypothetical protein